MRIGINEVLIYRRSTGTRQREINMLPALIRQIRRRRDESVVYVARDLEADALATLIGGAEATPVVRTPLPAIPTYQRLIKGLGYWPRQVLRDRLDIFHTAYYPVPKLPIPVVLTVNDVRFVHLPETYGLARRLFLALAVPLSLRRAARIIAISRDTRNDLVQRFGVHESKIDVVHIAADARFRPVTDEDRLRGVRQRHHLPQRFILCVGHLEPRKNLLRLVQAFARLRSTGNIPHHLVILGKPAFGFAPVLDEVAKAGIREQVVFTGYVEDDDMPAVYTLAELLAFPSLHEGFGVPVLEAMACGTPVLTSTVSALPELAGDAAVLVNPLCVEDIARGIARLLNDASLRRSLKERGFKRVDQFRPDRLAEQTVNTYDRVLRQTEL